MAWNSQEFNPKSGPLNILKARNLEKFVLSSFSSQSGPLKVKEPVLGLNMNSCEFRVMAAILIILKFWREENMSYFFPYKTDLEVYILKYYILYINLVCQAYLVHSSHSLKMHVFKTCDYARYTW